MTTNYYAKIETPKNAKKYGVAMISAAGQSEPVASFNSAIYAMAHAQQLNQTKKLSPAQELRLPTCYTALDTENVTQIDELLAELGIRIDRSTRALAISEGAVGMFGNEMGIVFGIIYQYLRNTAMYITGSSDGKHRPYMIAVGSNNISPQSFINDAEETCFDYEKTYKLQAPPEGARVILILARMLVPYQWSRARAEAIMLGAAYRTKRYKTVRCGWLCEYRANTPYFIASDGLLYNVSATGIEGSPEYAWTGDLTVCR